MSNEYSVNKNDLVRVADALRRKYQTSNGLTFPDDWVNLIDKTVKSLPSFYLIYKYEVLEFSFEDGWDWETFSNSSYNNGLFSPETDMSYNGKELRYFSNNEIVGTSEEIVPGGAYIVNEEKIHFYIESDKYYARSGMTFRQWINSDFESGSWHIAIDSESNRITDGYDWVRDDTVGIDDYVSADVVIVSGRRYTADSNG